MYHNEHMILGNQPDLGMINLILARIMIYAKTKDSYREYMLHDLELPSQIESQSSHIESQFETRTRTSGEFHRRAGAGSMGIPMPLTTEPWHLFCDSNTLVF